MKSLPKPAEENAVSQMGFGLILLGMGLITAAAVLMILMLPENSKIVTGKVFIYIFGFLGTGLLVAWLIYRWLERQGASGEEASWR